MSIPGERKDPVVAALLSFFFPGAGHAYVGDVPRFLVIFVAETFICCVGGGRTGPLLFFVVVHVFNTISAAGAAMNWNRRHADLPAPPPPATYSHAAADAPAAWSAGAPPPPPRPAPEPPAAPALRDDGPALSADDFLAELRDAWSDRQAGALDDRAFADRKRSAIERVRVTDVDDGVALLEAASALVGAGVLTSAERTRLKLRVSRA